MARPTQPPSGIESTFDVDELIVSKTDLRGIITYANSVFCRVAGFSEVELLGQPHNIIRHPDMPGCVFKLLWDTLSAGDEIFAYVVNQSRNGDHYWVFAHVTPSYDAAGALIGYHSNRRVPYPDAIPKVRALYAELLAVENRYTDRTAAVTASFNILCDRLKAAGVSYGEFVFSLSEHTRFGATSA
jgi:PAS domain S-box-containing protein